MSGNYEAILILNPDLKDPEVEAEIKKIEEMISAHAGVISKQDIWGRRQLAYKINKQEFGIYLLLIFTGDNTLVPELDRSLRINEACMRHLIVKKDKYAPDFAGIYRDDSLPSDDGLFGFEADLGFMGDSGMRGQGA